MKRNLIYSCLSSLPLARSDAPSEFSACSWEYEVPSRRRTDIGLSRSVIPEGEGEEVAIGGSATLTCLGGKVDVYEQRTEIRTDSEGGTMCSMENKRKVNDGC